MIGNQTECQLLDAIKIAVIIDKPHEMQFYGTNERNGHFFPLQN